MPVKHLRNSTISPAILPPVRSTHHTHAIPPITNAQNNGKLTYFCIHSATDARRLSRYLTLREAATSKVMITIPDSQSRSNILEAAKLVALSACIMDVEDPVYAEKLAHAAWSVLFVPGMVFESGKEVEQVSAILDLANGILSRGIEGEVELDDGVGGNRSG